MLLLALISKDPCTRNRERPLGTKGSPQMTAGRERGISVLQLRRTEFYQ